MKNIQQQDAAKHFAEYWKGKGYEKGESQKFWLSLLTDVFGVAHAAEYISFEDQVHLDHTSFIDGYIPATHVLIEQKGIGKDLKKPIKQSDGTLLKPIEQAKRYANELPYSQRPRWIITCNFRIRPFLHLHHTRFVKYCCFHTFLLFIQWPPRPSELPALPYIAAHMPQIPLPRQGQDSA